ncbi:MAG: trypsin-like peptidase domain-containing protein [Verrucomicrobiota bacterium]
MMRRFHWLRFSPFGVLFSVIWLAAGSPVLAEGKVEVEKHTHALEKDFPESKADLIAIQKTMLDVLDQAKAATVGIVSKGSGSGVIISPDGYVLTAGHVSGEPDADVTIVTTNGEHLEATSLGNIVFADAGLVKINGDGPFPYVEMGEPGQANPGDWCFVLGHPGGIDEDRGVVLRIGRVIRRRTTTIQTDCKLIGGDSGGPLFNMAGEVIGINSRISMGLDDNYHVTIRAFKRYWEKMRESQLVRIPRTYVVRNGGYLGVNKVAHARGVSLTVIVGDSPAEHAGLRSGDVITHVNDEPVEGTFDFSRKVGSRKPNEVVKFTFEREGDVQERMIELGTHPASS